MTKQAVKSLTEFDPKELAFSHLLSYAAIQWPAYDITKHIQIVSAYLEAIERRDIDRLMIFMPPRHGKTMLASEYFISWYMGRNPSHQIIYATYSHERAGDVGKKIRDQMVDPLHRAIFRNCSISADSKSASKLSTNQKGNVFSVGTGGAVTGRGADIFLIDDPIKGAEEADSKNAQLKLQEWFSAVAYTRLMPKAAIILIMTRWNYFDLAGWLITEKPHENWAILSLPAIAEYDEPEIGRKEGEALWPNSYPIGTLRRIKETSGSRVWNALYQQQPLPKEGGMVDLDWFQRYSWDEWFAFDTSMRMGAKKAKAPFKIEKIVCSWDTAFKPEELHDPSCGTIWGVSKTGYYLLYVINKKLDFPDLRKETIRVYNRNRALKVGKTTPVLIEDHGSGQSLIQELKRTTNIPIFPIKTGSKSKEFRLSEVTDIIEAGRVFIPDKAPWLINYETQMAQFPYGRHDDMVDSTSQFLQWAHKPKYKKHKGKLYWK